jgi:hypothetical protein
MRVVLQAYFIILWLHAQHFCLNNIPTGDIDLGMNRRIDFAVMSVLDFISYKWKCPNYSKNNLKNWFSVFYLPISGRIEIPCSKLYLIVYIISTRLNHLHNIFLRIIIIGGTFIDNLG